MGGALSIPLKFKLQTVPLYNIYFARSPVSQPILHFIKI